MDRFEYGVRLNEIKELISEGEFEEAAQIADTIDWRKVRMITTLCTISDLYKAVGRYQDSYEILLLAYDKHATRRIVYSLCELCIKLGDVVNAVEYLKEFCEIASDDVGQYILKYRLYEAQDVSIEERIEVLKKIVECDPTKAKWYYELAYLYHRIGFTSACIETCDEVFLYIVEGKYVIKALELKAMHVALSEEQQRVYDAWMREQNGLDVPNYNIDENVDKNDQSDTFYEEIYSTEDNNDYSEKQVSTDTLIAGDIHRSESEDMPITDVPTMELPEVKMVDVSLCNTINLEKTVAEGLKLWQEDEGRAMSEKEEAAEDDSEKYTGSEDVYMSEEYSESEDDDMSEEYSESEDDDMSEEYTELEDDDMSEEYTESEDGDMSDEYSEQKTVNTVDLYSDTDEDTDYGDAVRDSIIAPLLEETMPLPGVEAVEQNIPEEESHIQENMENEQEAEEIVKEKFVEEEPVQTVTQNIITPANAKSSEYDKILSQEYDGQISLVVPEAAMVEKQITGQMTVEELMEEWERMKANNKKERMEGVEQRILAHTGDLFASFDEATKNGVLEELERESEKAIAEESKKSPIKHVFYPDKDEPQEYEGETADIEESVITEDDVVEELEEIEDNSSDTEIAEEPLEEGFEAATVKEEKKTDEKPKKALTKNQADKKAANVTKVQENTTRELTEEELEMFGQFTRRRKAKQQIVDTLDNMSLASCTGNIIITGNEKDRTMMLAKGIIREMQYNDDNFSGKVAKISGSALNKKDIVQTFSRLDNGALIVEEAASLKPSIVEKIIKTLEKDNKGLLLIMIDGKHKINKLFKDHDKMNGCFNLRIDVEALDAETLVNYAKEYAAELEYSIDEFGVLALHTRIADMQTSDHAVTLAEVRELIDDAIYFANKKTPKHFMDILFAKRYDKEDMIILREKDFMHYE